MKNLVALKAESFGWTIPVFVTAETHKRVIAPRRAEVLAEREYLVLESLTVNAKSRRSQVCPFFVPPTPFRSEDVYCLFGGLYRDKKGSNFCLIAHIDEAEAVARMVKKL